MKPARAWQARTQKGGGEDETGRETSRGGEDEGLIPRRFLMPVPIRFTKPVLAEGEAPCCAMAAMISSVSLLTRSSSLSSRATSRACLFINRFCARPASASPSSTDLRSCIATVEDFGDVVGVTEAGPDLASSAPITTMKQTAINETRLRSFPMRGIVMASPCPISPPLPAGQHRSPWISKGPVQSLPLRILMERDSARYSSYRKLAQF